MDASINITPVQMLGGMDLGGIRADTVTKKQLVGMFDQIFVKLLTDSMKMGELSSKHGDGSGLAELNKVIIQRAVTLFSADSPLSLGNMLFQHYAHNPEELK